MDLFWIIVSISAAICVWIRFAPDLRGNGNVHPAEPIIFPKISVIIPARNEERSIGSVLTSLFLIDYPDLEIIVVDDGSTDRTHAIASSFFVKVISTAERPAGWMGKTWACHAGAKAAGGDYLLFTDADTVHRPDGLKRAITFLQQTGSTLVSTPAYHANRHWWEKFLGPFYCLIQAGASPSDPVSVDHPYALGQYLLIDADFYRRMDGHASIRSYLADDASLARQVMLRKGTYHIYKGAPICEVQMYENFLDFLTGWHRILRLGMNELNIKVIFNTLLPLLSFNIAAMLTFSVLGWIPVFSTLICFALVQPRIGNFSIAGLVFFPLPVLLFVFISTHALVFHLLNLPIEWRGRKYYLKNKMSI